MIDNISISQITYDYDFKKFDNKSYNKLLRRLDKNHKLIEDITDFKVETLKYKFEENEDIKNFLRYKLINSIYGSTIIDCDNIAITKELLNILLEKQNIKINSFTPKDNTNRIFKVNDNIER